MNDAQNALIGATPKQSLPLLEEILNRLEQQNKTLADYRMRLGGSISALHNNREVAQEVESGNEIATPKTMIERLNSQIDYFTYENNLLAKLSRQLSEIVG